MSTDTLDISPSLEDEFTGTDDNAPYRCTVCGNAVTYSGRGRVPKYCANCKPTRGTGTGTRSTTASTAKIVAALGDMYRGAGVVIAMVEPTDGMHIASSADQLATSWTSLIENDAKVRKYLSKMITGSGWSAVILAHVIVAQPIVMRHMPHLFGISHTNGDGE